MARILERLRKVTCWLALFLIVQIAIVSKIQAQGSKRNGKKAAPAQKVPKNLPDDAIEFLETLPNKKITIDLIIGAAIKSSDSFRALTADRFSIEVPWWQANAALGHYVYSGGQWTNNKNQITPAFQQTSNTNTVFAGTRSFFSTGTSITTELTQGWYDNLFIGGPIMASFYETKATLKLSQNLWKDAFGYATRLGLEAGEFARDANREALKESIEDWTLNLVQVFYTAWYSQARARAALSGIERRQRLQQIMGVKLNRGTAERPDFLQVESALIGSKADSSNAQQGLEEIWRELVTTLKFPKHWGDIDPIHIPLLLDNPVPEALELCKTAKPAKTSTTKKWELQAKAADLSASRAKNSFMPDTKLDLGLVTNDMHATDRAQTSQDTFKNQNPNWMLGITMTIPLSAHLEKAEYANALAQKERAEAMVSQSTGNLEVAWLNSCANLRRLNDLTQTLTEAYEKQTERARLDEGRFRLGRASPLMVIQAGDDATASELNLRNAEMMVRMTAWQVRRMAGQFVSFLKKIDPNLGELFAGSASQ